MDSNTDQRELREYVGVLRRRQKLVAAITLSCGLIALVVSVLETPTYRATAELLFESGSARLIVNPQSQRVGDPGRLLQNELQFLESERVSETAEAELGFTGEIEVVVSQPTGDIMFVSGESDDPDDAAALTNAHAEAYIAERREQAVEDFRDTIEVTQANLEEVNRTKAEAALRINELNAELANPTPLSDTSLLSSERNALQADQGSLFDQGIKLAGDLRELQLGLDLSTTEVASITVPAVAPGAPESPKPVRNVAVALLFGFVVGVGAAFLRDYFDDTIKTKDRLELALNQRVPTMALIPKLDSWKDDDEATLISVEDPESTATEGYRALRTSLSFLHLDESPQVIEVTSAAAGEGKSTTAANLAVAITRAGQHVLVVDGDLRRSRIHEFFGLSGAIGLTDAMQNDSLSGTIQEVPGLPSMNLLAAGELPPDPAEMLASDRLDVLFAELREHYDYIILDCPPVLPVADALSLSRFSADALVVVADAESTSIRNLRRAIGLIQQVEGPLVGTVLNRSAAIDDYYEPYHSATGPGEEDGPRGRTVSFGQEPIDEPDPLDSADESDARDREGDDAFAGRQASASESEEPIDEPADPSVVVDDDVDVPEPVPGAGTVS